MYSFTKTECLYLLSKIFILTKYQHLTLCKHTVDSDLKMKFIRKFKIELSYNPATSLLGIYPKELKGGTRTDIYILMFIATLFTIAKM